MLQDATAGSGGDSGKQAGQSFDINKVIAGYKDVLGYNLNLQQSITDSINQLETQANTIAKIFGGTSGFAKGIKQSFNEAIPSVVELGGTIDDVAKMQLGVIKSLQTQTIMNSENYKDLYASASLVSDGTTGIAESAGNLVKQFTNAGYGLNNIGKEMTGIINQAREIGVTAQAVYKQIGDSIAKLNMYNFEGGIQGMAKMAANAALLRIDMKSTLGLADQLFNPEKAVEMSAGFQRLGVQVSSLLDPYKLMDMARNDPAKLQDEMGKALQSLTYFDEKTQSMRILPGAQGHLREIAQLTGVGIEQITQWATASGDLSRKMSEIKFSPDFASDDDRKMIAGMAQLGEKGGKFEGQYVIKLPDGKEKAVTELSNADRDALKKINEPAKSAVDLQKEANGILNNLLNAVRAQRGTAARGLVVSDTFQTSMNTVAKNMLSIQEALNSVSGIKRSLDQGDKTGYLSPASLDKTMAAMAVNITSIVKDVLRGDFSAAGNDGLSTLTSVFSKGMDMITEFPEELKKSDKYYGANAGESINESIDLLNKAVTAANVTLEKFGLGGLLNIPNIPSISASTQTVTPAINNIPQPQSLPAGSNINVITPSTINEKSSSSIIEHTGTININVTPTEFSESLKTAFRQNDVQQAIFNTVNLVDTRMADLKGSGRGSNKLTQQQIG